MNLSVVIIYSIFDCIINAFSSSLRPFDPKRRVSSIIESLWFNKERLMLLVLSKRVFDLSDLSSGENSEQLFNMPTAVAKWALEIVLEIVSQFVFTQMIYPNS